MILAWMVYSSAVGLLFAAAATLLEGPLRERGLPTRWRWIISAGALVLLPAAALVQWQSAPATTVYRFTPADHLPASLPAAEPAETWMTTAATLSASEPLESIGSARADLNRWLLVGWITASALLALLLSLSAAALRHRRRGWRRTRIDAREVLITPDTGPAVVGAFPGSVALPEWFLGLPRSERELILRHEEEHIRARDPLLLLAALLLRIALPWHPAVWWIGRALRRAVEIDCDGRVLASGADARAYARVLLGVSERGTAHRLTVAALSESQSFLERRIRLMIGKPLPMRGPRSAVAVTLAFAAAVAACQVDQPASEPLVATGFSLAPAEAETPAPEAARSVEPAPPLQQSVPALSNSELGDSITATFRSIVEAHHPEVLTGEVRGDRVNLYVMIDGNGDLFASAVDTEARSGSCTRILAEGLGIKPDRETLSGAGCGRLEAGEAGPSQVHFFWSTTKPANEQERLAPTGPYQLSRLLQASRPTREQMVAAVRAHFPEVYQQGLPQGEVLWFVGDRYHRVVHSGRGWQRATSLAAREAVEEELPGVALEGGSMGGVRSARDTPIGIFWASLANGSVPPPKARPDPYPHAQTFAVSANPRAAEPYREVEIELESEAASDPSAFRIVGRFTNEDGVLTAVTPFTLVVLTSAPYRATLRLKGGGEMRLYTEVDGRPLTTTSGAIRISRLNPGELAEIRSANMIATERPSVNGLPVAEPIAR